MIDFVQSRQVSRFLVALVLLGLALSSSGSGPPQIPQSQAEPPTPTSETPISGIATADPSAVYCLDLGYEHQVVDGPDGQYGICRFPDGQECDAWAFLQGQCGQEYSYCARQGYGIETWSDGQDPFSPVYAVCVNQATRGVGAAVVGSVTDLTDLSDKVQGAGCSPGEGGVSSPAPEGAGAAEPLATTGLVGTPDLVGGAPSSFDWRDHLGVNWMTPVKNQGGCGSCWAFAAVGATEAVHNIAANDPNLDLDLSEQYLVSDCSGAGSCCGGWHQSALRFIRDSGVPDEGCMSYVDGTGCSCNSGCSASCTYSGSGACSDRTCGDRCADWQSRLTTINDYYSLSNSGAMKEYIATYGPVVVLMGIGSFYGGDWDEDGIYRCASDSGVNHAVVAAGYNNAGGYWIIKNSWGTGWGSGGYFKLGYGECMVERYAYAPYVDTTPPPVPVLRKPTDGSTNYKLKFQWYKAESAVEYQIQVDDDPGFGSREIDDTSLKAKYKPVVMPPFGDYYWRVRARDAAGNWSEWSDVWGFQYTILKKPGEDYSTSKPAVKFSWRKVKGALEYQIQVADNPDFNNPEIDDTSLKNKYEPVDPFAPGTYNWRVRVRTAGGWEGWTPGWAFTVTP